MFFFSFKSKIQKVPLLFNEKNNDLLQPVLEQDFATMHVCDFHQIFWQHWNDTLSEREEFMVLFFRNSPEKFKVLGVSLESIGTCKKVTFNVSRIKKRANLIDASTVVFAHNHIDYHNLGPSKADILATFRAKEAFDRDGIELLDHIILTPKKKFFYSFYEAKIL